MKEEIHTEEKILEAAKKIFHRRGYDGARMQDIADEAGINKAMLHYYYRSKDKLFEAVFIDALSRLVPVVSSLFEKEMSFDKKIENLFEIYINFLGKNEYVPGFVIYELMHNPDKLEELFSRHIPIEPNKILAQFQKQIKPGLKKKIDPRQILINLLAWIIFPIVAKPMLKAVLGISEKDYSKLIQDRKKILPELFLNSIKGTTK